MSSDQHDHPSSLGRTAYGSPEYSGVVATSRHETLLLTSMGDVLLCRHYDSLGSFCFNNFDAHNEGNDSPGEDKHRYSWNMNSHKLDAGDGNEKSAPVQMSQTADPTAKAQTDSTWEECCSINSPQGLCGGAQDTIGSSVSEEVQRTDRDENGRGNIFTEAKFVNERNRLARSLERGSTEKKLTQNQDNKRSSFVVVNPSVSTDSICCIGDVDPSDHFLSLDQDHYSEIGRQDALRNGVNSSCQIHVNNGVGDDRNFLNLRKLEKPGTSSEMSINAPNSTKALFFHKDRGTTECKELEQDADCHCELQQRMSFSQTLTNKSRIGNKGDSAGRVLCSDVDERAAVGNLVSSLINECGDGNKITVNSAIKDNDNGEISSRKCFDFCDDSSRGTDYIRNVIHVGDDGHDNIFAASPSRGIANGSHATIQTKGEYDINGLGDIAIRTNGNNQSNGSSIGTSSPTPVVSFDYHGYEPPTPEQRQSLDDRSVTSPERPMNTCGSKVLSKIDSSSKILNQEANMPISANESVNISSIGVSPPTSLTFIPPNNANSPFSPSSHQGIIGPAFHESKQPTRSCSLFPQPKYGDSSFVLPGIPTFLDHLSQIRISRLSAHPSGHHALLISEEGLLFSYGSNDRGQLGLGKQTRTTQNSSPCHEHFNNYRVTAPSIVTPLLENGGKTIDCAAGLDYSLVVVRTEVSRMASRRKQRQHFQQRHCKEDRSENSSKEPESSSPNSSQSRSSQPYMPLNANEWVAHHQMYAFGSNDNMKLGLLDPYGSRNISDNHANVNPRRRRRDDGELITVGEQGYDAGPALKFPQVTSPSSPTSSQSLSNGNESSNGEYDSNDVLLPRRVGLHCKVISQKLAETYNQSSTSTKLSIKSQPPFGIFSVAASVDHSAALVRRPSGAVELYTWGRGEEGALGLTSPTAVLGENSRSSLKPAQATSLPPRRWETIPPNIPAINPTPVFEDNLNDTQKRSKIYSPVLNAGSMSAPNVEVQSNRSMVGSFFVSSPTVVESLSFRPLSDKASHPPLPKNSSGPKLGSPPRSPRKKQDSNRHLSRDGPSQQHRYNGTNKNKSNSRTNMMGGSNLNEFTPLLHPLEYLVNVELGTSCTHVITSRGRNLVFGSSADGLLGLGNDVNQTFFPVEVKFPLIDSDSEETNSMSHHRKIITSISVGHKHVVAVTNEGDAFTWGRSDHGVLGHSPSVGEPLHSSSIVPFPRRTLFNNLFMTRFGDHLNSKLGQYIRGQGKVSADALSKRKGKVGNEHPPSTSTKYLTKKHETLDHTKVDVIYAHAGFDLSVFILRSGLVLSCGKQSGRLGQGNVGMDVNFPLPLFGGLQLWNDPRD